MHVSWRGPLLCASAHAAGARDALAGLHAAGARLTVEHTPWTGAAAATDAERAFLAARQAPPARPGVHVQRTLARLLDAHVPATARVAWITLPAAVCDRETALRAAAFDLVLVPDRAQRDALVAAGLAGARVRVMPEPVLLPARVTPAALPCTSRGTIAVALAPPGAAGGLDLLVAAWARAFTPADDVALVVLTDGGGGAEAAHEAAAALTARGLDPAACAEIVLVPDALGTAGLAAAVAAAHVVVAPARAPGFAREIAVARVLGVPVIAPARAGGTDAAGWTVDVRAERCDAVPGEDLPWHAPDEDALAEALAAAHADPAARAARADASRPLGAAHDGHAAGRLLAGVLGDLRQARTRRRHAADRPPLMLLEGDLLGATSLAGVNRSLIAALAHEPALRVAAVERDARRVEPLAPGGALARAMGAAGVPDVVVRHFHPPSFAPAAAGRLAQFVHWEFGHPPPEWMRGLRRADETWVASRAVGDALAEAGLPAGRVRLMPLGVDAARFADAAPADLGDAAPGFRFLFVGGLVWRKGADLLLEAYGRAFTAADDVTLVLKDVGPGGPYPAGDEDARAEAMAVDGRGPRVLRVRGAQASDALPALYRACHCLVHPFRAEAFGLTMLEAAAAGLPVIASGHGPVREFLPDAAGLLLPTRPTRVDVDRIGPWALDRPLWVHEPGVDDLADAMRAVVADARGRAAMGAAGAAAARRATWARSAAAVRDGVLALAAGAEAVAA